MNKAMRTVAIGLIGLLAFSGCSNAENTGSGQLPPHGTTPQAGWPTVEEAFEITDILIWLPTNTNMKLRSTFHFGCNQVMVRL